VSRRHVRVLTALFAAITLHALLLNWLLPASKQLSVSNALLHVELLKNAPTDPLQAKAAAPATVATSPAESPRQTVKPKLRHKAVVRRHSVAVQQHQAAFQPVAKAVNVQAVASAHQQPRRSRQTVQPSVATARERVRQGRGKPAAPGVRSMPASAQSMLLANIRYPRLARRRGWQGKGEFQMAIVSQSIRNITMLVSTGHAVLDRAVQRGLSGVDHIPVADGQYRLPVEFRLQ